MPKGKQGRVPVYANTIRETLYRHRQVIVSSYFAECGQLAETLSQSAKRVGVGAALAARIDSYSVILPGAQALAPARHDRMPYRMFFGQIQRNRRGFRELAGDQIGVDLMAFERVADPVGEIRLAQLMH